ncbi:hypothetical protein [Conexibacter sp. CPCC 206217]|uniref:hypothetical protein n=1 Tax=Conexibacter sp. CPCC 206217 TaxID=3064574 RepID=UPI002717979B|nr:hypothetical protein [Conexibacter sp. CPCC 206217]MDO8213005.1 hypothetical protein [Conexibacter sp. CPCC 206217]
MGLGYACPDITVRFAVIDYESREDRPATGGHGLVVALLAASIAVMGGSAVAAGSEPLPIVLDGYSRSEGTLTGSVANGSGAITTSETVPLVTNLHARTCLSTDAIMLRIAMAAAMSW